MQKANIIKTGRELVIKNGPDFLTIRKLSVASNASVGLIYGLFENVENIINEVNKISLAELSSELSNTPISKDPYQNLNCFVDVFNKFVKENTNLWNLLKKSNEWQSGKQIAKITNMVDKEFAILFSHMNNKKRKLAARLIIISIFSVSNILLENPKEIKVLLNTYLAGLKVLEIC